MQHLVDLCVATAGVLASASAIAASDVAGRWEGVADVPGNPIRLVVDLAPGAAGPWEGSAILPGRGVKGAPLSALAVDGCDVHFDLSAAFAGGAAAPRVALACAGDGMLAGELTLGGQSARVSLRRSGEAQVDRPAVSSVLGAALAGRWTGRYDMGGYARQVTLTLANRPGAGGTGQMVVVGKRTTTLEIDQVTQGREFVTLRAHAADVTIEGRFTAEAGLIEGVFSQGPFEAPLVLRREQAS